MNYPSKQPFLKSPSMMRVVFFVVFIFSVILLISIISLYPKSRDAVRARNQAREELQALKEKEEELKMKIDSLNTKEGQEEALRSKYYVADEGEGVVVILDKEEEAKIPEKNFFENLKSSLNRNQ